MILINNKSPRLLSNADILVSMDTNNIHLYYCDLRDVFIDEGRLLEALNETDTATYHRFNNSARRKQFAIARWLIKKALSDLLNLPLCHHYELVNYHHWKVRDFNTPISLSISHSGHFVTVALVLAKQSIGLDIEQQKTRKFKELLEGFSTENEQAGLNMSLDQQSYFYQLWTIKEAFLKISQFPLTQVCEQDFSKCISRTSGQILGYHFQYIDLVPKKYCVCLMSDVAINLQLKHVI